MNESKEREQSLQPMTELAVHLNAEMGETSAQRLDWIARQTPESFSETLVGINAVARCAPQAEHSFDGHNVRAGTVDGSVPPDQNDKLLLLNELISMSQQYVTDEIGSGTSEDEIWRDIAVVVPTVINKLHLFANGNGRTSRLLRMTMISAPGDVADNTEAVINKKSLESFDATPVRPIDRSVTLALRAENDTQGYHIVDDMMDYDAPVEANLELLSQGFPDIEKDVLAAYEDSANFNETIKLLAKARGEQGEISLSTAFELLRDPAEQQLFREVYAGVRKQRVEVLMRGLYGVSEVPFKPNYPKSAYPPVARFINDSRQKKGLPDVDPETIKTIADFQKLYMDVMSPAQ